MNLKKKDKKKVSILLNDEDSDCVVYLFPRDESTLLNV